MFNLAYAMRIKTQSSMSFSLSLSQTQTYALMPADLSPPQILPHSCHCQNFLRIFPYYDVRLPSIKWISVAREYECEQTYKQSLSTLKVLGKAVMLSLEFKRKKHG